MVVVSNSYGTLPGAPGVRPQRLNQKILAGVAVAAVGTVAMACMALYSTSSSSVSILVEGSKTHTLAATYVTDKASIHDMDKYWDSQNKVAATRHGDWRTKHLTAEQAKQQLNAIFDTPSTGDVKKIHSVQKKSVMQDLAYSAKDANSDLDSYFDDMNKQNMRANRAKLLDEDSDSSNAVDDDGLPTVPEMSHARKEASALNKEELENYKKTNPEFKKKMDEVHLKWMEQHGHMPNGKAEIQQYAMMIDKYVGDIGELVKTAKKSDSKVLKEDPALRKQALQKYLDEHPDVKTKMAAAKKRFFEKYGHQPRSRKQNQEYHDLMKKYVGHVDVSVKDELGLDTKQASKASKAAATAQKAKTPAATAQKLLVGSFNVDAQHKGFREAGIGNQAAPQNHFDVGTNIVFNGVKSEGGIKGVHGIKSADSADKKKSLVGSYPVARKGMPKPYSQKTPLHNNGVGDQIHNSARKVPAAAAGDSKKQFKVARGDTKLAAAAAEPEHSEAELKLAKVNALQDLEKHDPKVKAKIEQVHQAWMKAGHKAPPANAGEEKEYKALMKQIVGHPDVSFQYSN